MARKIVLLFALLFGAALTACGGGETEEVTRVVTETVTERVEVEVTRVVTETKYVEQVPAGLTEALATIAAQTSGNGVLAATPVAIETEPTTQSAEVDPNPTPIAYATGEESATGASPVFTRTYTLQLPDYFTQTVEFSGWSPIHLHPNGDWYREFMTNDSWNSISQTWKRAAEGCSLPGACNVYSPSGVLGADDYTEAQANESAVWTGSMWHDSPDGNGFNLLCPEGSYCDVYAQNFGSVTIGDPDDPYLHFSIPSCGKGCGQGLTIRNWLSREGVDLNTNIRVEDYGAPSAASWTEYNVAPSAAEYFSQEYLTAQAVSAHSQHVNGSGPGDNHTHIHWVLDLNDMSLTIMGHTNARGWFLIWSNVGSYGIH